MKVTVSSDHFKYQLVEIPQLTFLCELRAAGSSFQWVAAFWLGFRTLVLFSSIGFRGFFYPRKGQWKWLGCPRSCDSHDYPTDSLFHPCKLLEGNIPVNSIFFCGNSVFIYGEQCCNRNMMRSPTKTVK